MVDSIYYEARIRGRFGPLSLLALQKRCIRRNLDAGISSFLFLAPNRVLQVLEGSTEALDRAMASISRSKVLEDIKFRAIMRDTERHFAHWPFGTTHAQDPDMKRALNASQQSDFFALDVLQAQKLLRIVASRKRRALKNDPFSTATPNFRQGNKPRSLYTGSLDGSCDEKKRLLVPRFSKMTAASA